MAALSSGRAVAVVVFSALLGVAVAVGSAAPAGAAIVPGGPIDLGSSGTYGALAASELTNTGPTTVGGDIGVSPGSSITGFSVGNGTYTGAENDNNAAAAGAQADLTTAFDAAASLTPTTSGLSELDGLSLTPGVYAGGALSLAGGGALTLAGTASSVWVFQAASELTVGSAGRILITGGASACNVFWEVGSSATLGTGAQFQGTVLARQSITAATGATVIGRLLANTAAVTLDTNTITVPSGCAPGAAPVTTDGPAITSGPPTPAQAGTPYSFTVTATGTPGPTFSVTSGALPAGLQLDAVTGAITGTPSAPGSSTFTITAANGVLPNTSAVYTIGTSAAPLGAAPGIGGSPATAAELAASGIDPTGPLLAGGTLVAAGLLVVLLRRRRPVAGRRASR